MNRVNAIKKIINDNQGSIIIISNGLSSREANYFLDNKRLFYMLHAMGESLSVGMGMIHANKKIKVVVIDGDYNAIMGSSSWHLLPNYKNLKYYILNNNISQTTGSQKIPKPLVPLKLKNYIKIIKIFGKKLKTPNPDNPKSIKKKIQDWFKKNNII